MLCSGFFLMPGAHKSVYVQTGVWYGMAELCLPHVGVLWWGAGLLSSLLGEVGRVVHACLHPIPCFDSLVVVAASWGLISDFGWDFRSQAAERFEAQMSVFKASALTTEALKGRGTILSNCLRGKGKKLPLSIALGRGEGRWNRANSSREITPGKRKWGFYLPSEGQISWFIPLHSISWAYASLLATQYPMLCLSWCFMVPGRECSTALPQGKFLTASHFLQTLNRLLWSNLF